MILRRTRLCSFGCVSPFVASPYVNQKFMETSNAMFPIVSDFNREATIAFEVVRPDLSGLKEVSEIKEAVKRV